MIDAVQSLNLAVPSSGAAAMADTDDVSRFRAALGAPVDSPRALGGPDPLLAPTGTAALAPIASGKRSAGDSILDGLQKASAEMNQSWAQAAKAIGKPELSSSDMLRLQLTLVQASVHFELFGKGISKATQNLDQILKTQ